MTSQLLTFAKMDLAEAQSQDLNSELAYVQPFRTPMYVFGKMPIDTDTADIINIICYSFGVQKNIFWGTYSIKSDILKIDNICRYTSISVINKMLEERKYDGYILLSDVAKNKMQCEYEYHISNALENKKSFGFLNAITLAGYVKIIEDRLKTGNIDEAVTLFCKYYKYSLYLYSEYNKYIKDSPSAQTQSISTQGISTQGINNALLLQINNAVQEFNGIVIPREIFLALDELISSEAQDSQDSQQDSLMSLTKALDVSIATYKDINLRGIKVHNKKHIAIANSIIDKIEKRTFLNSAHKDIKTCPKYSDCAGDLTNLSDLCMLYTNFLL